MNVQDNATKTWRRWLVRVCAVCALACAPLSGCVGPDLEPPGGGARTAAAPSGDEPRDTADQAGTAGGAGGAQAAAGEQADEDAGVSDAGVDAGG